eukprot:7324154-Prymnesium_polylepis.1
MLGLLTLATCNGCSRGEARARLDPRQPRESPIQRQVRRVHLIALDDRNAATLLLEVAGPAREVHVDAQPLPLLAVTIRQEPVKPIGGWEARIVAKQWGGVEATTRPVPKNAIDGCAPRPCSFGVDEHDQRQEALNHGQSHKGGREARVGLGVLFNVQEMVQLDDAMHEGGALVASHIIMVQRAPLVLATALDEGTLRKVGVFPVVAQLPDGGIEHILI